MSDSVEIVIDSRVLMVGHEAYQLTQVSRVSTYTQIPRPANGKYIAVIVIGGLLFLSGASAQAAVLIVLGLAIAGLGIWRLVVARSARELYILLIESSGVVRGVVGSHQQSAIADARDAILQALRTPPQSPVRVWIGDAVTGDKISQFGDHNTGKIGSR
jgi:hypothetical protein